MKKTILFILITGIILIVIIFIIFFTNDDQKKITEYRNFLEQKNIPEDEKIKTAYLYLESAIKVNDINEMIHAYTILGNHFQTQHNTIKSIEYFLKVYNLAKDSKYHEVKSDICYKIGINYLVMGEYVNAHTFAMETYSIERKYKFSERSAETLNLLGSIYEKSGLYIKSLATHFESLELQKEKRNNRGIANSYHNLAHIYMLGERYDNAYTYYFKALDIYQNLLYNTTDSVDIEANIVKIQIAIGNYFVSQNDSTNALNFLNKALNISKRTNDRINLAQSLFNIGNVYFQWRNYAKARDYYLKSLEISKKENNKIGIVTSNINLGRIYYFNNQTKKAIEVFENGVNLAIEIKANRQIAEISDLLYSIYSEFPDSIRQTKKYASLFIKSRKYIPDEKTQDSIIQMSVKHEVTAEKNKEISIEKYEKRIRTILLSSVLVIVIIGFVFIFYRNKAKQQAIYEKRIANEQMIRFKEVFNAIEKERKRIAIDLHDSVGQMLSTTKLYFSGLEDLVEQQNKHNKMLYAEAINLLDASSAELRNISYNIMPDSLIKYGLKSAVEEIINKISNGSEINFNFKSVGFDKRQSETLEITIYRIIQEALNNILKHASATIVNIYLMKESDKINLLIYDNGKGMENFDFYKNKGLGWKSIFSRVQMLNGKIAIDTGINQGTKIDIMIPV